MIKIEEYMRLSRDVRTAHLKLNEECTLRACGNSTWYSKNGMSTLHKGLLAHILDTELPIGIKNVYLCHACNNNQCCNPFHHYWGTAADNYADMVKNGEKTFSEKIIAKYGVNYKRPKLSPEIEAERCRKISEARKKRIIAQQV